MRDEHRVRTPSSDRSEAKRRNMACRRLAVADDAISSRSSKGNSWPQRQAAAGFVEIEELAA